MTNVGGKQVVSESGDRKFPVGVIVYFLALHAVLLAYDCINRFAPFFRVDRSEERIEAMNHLLSASTLSGLVNAIVTNNIIAGEYVLQTGLIQIGGPLAVIIFQLALLLCSVFAVYRIARLALESSALSAAAAYVYASLPNSIVFAHQFSSEGLAVPLVVISFWLLAEYLIADASWKWLLLAGCLFGLAACVRPVLILLPACLSLCVLARRGSGVIRDAVALTGSGALFPLMLAALFFATRHEVALENSHSIMGFNLYLKVMKMTLAFPEDEQKKVVERYFGGKMKEECFKVRVQPDGSTCSLPASDYASFVFHYPVANAKNLLRDLLTFMAKSGASSLTVSYFDSSPEGDNQIKDFRNGWHEVWETQGLYAAIMSVIRLNPVAAVFELAGGCIFLLLSGCFLVGCLEIRRIAAAFSRPRIIVLCALAVLPAYIFATSEIASHMQSRYRYPGEFAMCILATFGGAALTQYVKTRSRPVTVQ